MKKRNLAGIVFLFSILILSLVSAEDITNTFDQINNDLSQIKDTANQIPSAPSSSNMFCGSNQSYLAKEWTSLLEKTSIGQFFLGISTFLNKFSGVFKFFLGMNYEASWLFFLTLLLWIFIFYLIYKPLKKVFVDKVYVAVVLAAAVPTLAARANALSISVSSFCPFFTNIWAMLIALLIVIVLLIIYNRLIGGLGKQIRREKKEAEERRREETQRLKDKLDRVKIGGSP